MEILQIRSHYEVWDYMGARCFSGTEYECEEYILCHQDYDNDE